MAAMLTRSGVGGNIAARLRGGVLWDGTAEDERPAAEHVKDAICLNLGVKRHVATIRGEMKGRKKEAALRPERVESEHFDQSLLDHAVRCWDAERENAARLLGRTTLVLSAVGFLFGLGLYRIDLYRGEHEVPRVSPLWAAIIKGLLSASLASFGGAFIGLFSQRAPIFWRLRIKNAWRRACYRAAQTAYRLSTGRWTDNQLRARSGRSYQINLLRRAKAMVLRHERWIRPKSKLSIVPYRARASDCLALPDEFFDAPPPPTEVARKLVFTKVYSAYLDLRRRNAKRDQELNRYQQLFMLGLLFVIGAVLCFILSSDGGIIAR